MTERKWQNVSGGAVKYYSASKMQPNEEIEGEYIGSSIDENYGNLKYEIKGPTGTSILNGCGHLDFLIKGVEIGSYIKITYLGKEKLTTGKMAGKFANKFAVAVDTAHDKALDSPSPGVRGEFAPQRDAI